MLGRIKLVKLLLLNVIDRFLKTGTFLHPRMLFQTLRQSFQTRTVQIKPECLAIRICPGTARMSGHPDLPM